jgi:hypothetical protein
MPQNTLVITPGKMAAFYSHHKVELEEFPFTGMSALSDQTKKTGMLTVKQRSSAAVRGHLSGWPSSTSSWRANTTSSRPSPKRGPRCQG